MICSVYESMTLVIDKMVIGDPEVRSRIIVRNFAIYSTHVTTR